MNPLLRLLGAAASHGLLTGQIVYSSAFVGACELTNWIQAPRQVNACRSRNNPCPALPPRHADRSRYQPGGLGSRPARGVPMNRPIPAGDDVEHFDPELPHHTGSSGVAVGP